MIDRGLVYASQKLVTPWGSTAPAANELSKDMSRFKNNGTETSVTYTQLPSGLWVFTQNANTDRISLGVGESLNFTYHSFTLMGWYYPTSAATQRIICKGVQSTSGYEMIIISSGNLGIYTSQSGFVQYTSSAASRVTVNSWNFLASTRIGANCYVFVNGIDRTSILGVHVSPDSSLAYNTYLGNKNDVSVGFIGSYALARIYNRALSQDEINQIFSQERSLFNV